MLVDIIITNQYYNAFEECNLLLSSFQVVPVLKILQVHKLTCVVMTGKSSQNFQVTKEMAEIGGVYLRRSVGKCVQSVLYICIKCLFVTLYYRKVFKSILQVRIFKNLKVNFVFACFTWHIYEISWHMFGDDKLFSV